MQMQSLHSLLPELAVDESEVLYDLQSDERLPPGDYGIAEHYCADPDCDCRRALLTVVSSHGGGTPWASIQLGWEDASFYAAQLDLDDPSDPAALALKGPSLSATEPQSEHADFLLDVVMAEVLTDDFVAKLKRHYALFKEAIPVERRPRSNPEASAQERRKRRQAIKKKRKKR